MASPIQIQLPPEALPDLDKIASLAPDAFESLLTAIKQTGPTLRGWEFSNNIAKKVPLIDRGDVGSLMSATVSLYVIRGRSDVSLSAQEIADGIMSSSLIAESQVFTPEKKQILSDRIIKLLDCDKSIGVTSKAFDVMTEHENVFCDARILSDIRPVFANQPETADAAVIIHNLEIGFHCNGERQEIYVALDTRDIKHLKMIIERAEKKDKALQSIIRQSNIPYLEP